MGRQIMAEEYGILPGDRKDTVLILREVLKKFRGVSGLELVFKEGIYHFYPDYAVEKFLCISNHDEDTIKRIAFDLTGFTHFIICGQNTEFRFHTDIIPFYIRNCLDIRIEGIRIDYERPAYSEAVIRDVDARRMVLAVDKREYPYEIWHGRVLFKGENMFQEITHGCLEMDKERLAPVFRGTDISFNRPYQESLGAVFRELEDGLIEVCLTDPGQRFPENSCPGNRLILRHHARTHPAFYLDGSEDIFLRNITVYHCTGMAVIAQFCENMVLEHFDIRIHPDKKRIFTAAADGFHFVYCRGRIQIRECFLENQLDDPVNIHGIYGRIHRVISDNEVLAELVEGMHKGVPLGTSGESFAVVDHETMLDIDSFMLAEHRMLNKDFQYLRFDKRVPSLRAGDVLENRDYVPDVLIEGCVFRNNRARGLLLTSAGNVMVRNNTFCTAGAAVLIEGDSNYWFESGSTRNISLVKNRFIDCAYVPQWGKAPIQVTPGVKTYAGEERYHKYLELKNNDFYCFDGRVLYARNIEKICMEGNQIHHTDTFPAIPGKTYELEGVVHFFEDKETRI